MWCHLPATPGLLGQRQEDDKLRGSSTAPNINELMNVYKLRMESQERPTCKGAMGEKEFGFVTDGRNTSQYDLFIQLKTEF